MKQWHLCAALLFMQMVGGAQNEQTNDLRTITGKIRSADLTATTEWLNLDCIGNYDIQSQKVALQTKREHLAILVTSPGCDQFAILVFQPSATEPEKWSYDQTLRLKSFDSSTVKMTFPSFAQRDVHEIMLSGVVSDHGSGVMQSDRIILKLIGNKLSTIFDEPENVRFVANGIKVFQSSSYSILSSKEGGMQGFQFLRESRTVSVMNRKFARQRNCFWDSGLEHFSCVEGVPTAVPK